MLWQKHKVEKFEAEEKKKVGVMQNGDMPLKKKKKPGASLRNQGEGQRKNVAERKDGEGRKDAAERKDGGGRKDAVERKDGGVQKESGAGKGAKSKAIDYRFTPCLESFHCAHWEQDLNIEIIAPTACIASMWMRSRETGKLFVMDKWSPSG